MTDLMTNQSDSRLGVLIRVSKLLSTLDLDRVLNQVVQLTTEVLTASKGAFFLREERATAFAFLSTRVGQRLLKSTAVGTSIPSMRLDLLALLPYPELSKDERAAVTRHVGMAEQARIAATEAEMEAVRIVEEEVLPQWLA